MRTRYAALAATFALLAALAATILLTSAIGPRPPPQRGRLRRTRPPVGRRRRSRRCGPTP